MGATTTLPDVNTVSELIESTIAKQVRASKLDPAGPVSGEVTAVYANDQGEPVAACVAELKLAACLGAALLLIPASSALEAAAQGAIPETMADGLRELLNITTQLFRPELQSSRIFLRDVNIGGAPPDDVAAGLARPVGRLDIEVEVSGYATGKMTLVVLA